MDDDSVAIFPCKLPVKMVINCSWYGQWHCSSACSTAALVSGHPRVICICSVVTAACSMLHITAPHIWYQPLIFTADLNFGTWFVSPQGRDVCKRHATADLQWTLANKYWDSSMIVDCSKYTRYYIIKYRFIINPKVEIQCNFNAMLFKVDR